MLDILLYVGTTRVHCQLAGTVMELEAQQLLEAARKRLERVTNVVPKITGKGLGGAEGPWTVLYNTQTIIP